MVSFFYRLVRWKKKAEDMICPQCGAEYREGFTLCADCNVQLVPEMPGIQQGIHVGDENTISDVEPDFIKLLTVYETGNPAFIVFAKSILESEDIKYYFKGEGIQDLFAGGRLGTGYNPVIGPVEIQVNEKDAEKARELLNQMEKGEFDLLEIDAEDNRAENFEDRVTDRHTFKDHLKAILNFIRSMQRD
jgi:hypothetical protein